MPNGERTAPRPSESGDPQGLEQLRVELGLGKGEINATHLQNLLVTLVENELEARKADTLDRAMSTHRKNIALKVFYLILFNKIICVGKSARISREPNMVKGLVFDKMKYMDYCQLAVDEIKRSAIIWQDPNRRAWQYVEGFSLGPLPMYFDSLLYKSLAEMSKKTPRLLQLEEKDMNAIARADCMDGSTKDDPKYGRIIVSTSCIM